MDDGWKSPSVGRLARIVVPGFSRHVTRRGAGGAGYSLAMWIIGSVRKSARRKPKAYDRFFPGVDRPYGSSGSKGAGRI